MPFLAPLMLWGSLAAGIPIALHFFFRSRYRTVPWAAMKFLLESIEQTSRRMKFQELLLLLVRVAMMMLLALALARPLSSVIRGAGQGAAVDCVFLFDTSGSMGASDGGKSRIERAQDAALSIIDQLPPHSTVQIITCADRALAESSSSDSTTPNVLGLLGPRSTGDLDSARKIIKEIKVTSLATDLKDGIVSADAVLNRAANTNRELYIFSDLQKTGWQQHPAAIRKTMEDIGKHTAITVVQCGQRELNNVAIVDVTPQTDVPRPGERVDFAVVLKHTSGSKNIDKLELTLLVDGNGKNGDSQTVKAFKPGEVRVVTLSGKLEKAGKHTVTAIIKNDDLPGDNRFDFVVEVRDQVNVLVVDGGTVNPEDRRREDKASSYYLMHALLPVAEAQYSRYYMQPTRVIARQASPGHLTKKDLCILVNAGMPLANKDDEKAAGPRNVVSHDFLEALERFVKDGKGVIIYGGDQVQPRQYNKVLGDMYHLLPLPLKVPAKGYVHKFDPKKPPMHVNRATFELPAYDKFKKDANFELFDKIEIYQAHEVIEPARKDKKDAEREAAEKKEQEQKKKERRLSDDERKEEEKKKAEEDKKKIEAEKREALLHVTLRYQNGWPAVISRKIGAGEAIFITTAAETGSLTGDDNKDQQFTWNNWAVNGMLGPFVKSTVNHLLAGATQEHNYVAGKTFTWIANDKVPKAFTLIHPDPDDSPQLKRDGEPGASATGAKDEDKAKQERKRRLERLGLPTKDETTGRQTVSANDLYFAGIYRIVGLEPPSAGKEDEAEEKIDVKKDGFPIAVTPDLSESQNLDSFKPDDFDKFLDISPAVRHLKAEGEEARSTGSDRLNREWTLWLLAILLMFALFESALAYWCSRSW